MDRLKLDLLGAEGVAEGASGGRAAGRRPEEAEEGPAAACQRALGRKPVA